MTFSTFLATDFAFWMLASGFVLFKIVSFLFIVWLAVYWANTIFGVIKHIFSPKIVYITKDDRKDPTDLF